MRPGDAVALPGRAGRGLSTIPKASSPSASGRRAGRSPDARRTGGGGGGAQGGEEAGDHRRRRRALFGGLGRTGEASPRRTAFRSGDPRRQVLAAATTIRSTWARSASPAPRPPTCWPRRPTSCSPSARGCRISPPAPGRCSRMPARRIVGLNAQPFDAGKHRALPLVADAGRRARRTRRRRSKGWKAPAAWTDKAAKRQDGLAGRRRQGDDPTNAACPSDAQVIGAVQRALRLERDAVCCRRRPAGRVAQALAGRRAGQLPHRIRLLDHGLRDRRRARRQAGASPTRTSSSWSATAAT